MFYYFLFFIIVVIFTFVIGLAYLLYLVPRCTKEKNLQYADYLEETRHSVIDINLEYSIYIKKICKEELGWCSGPVSLFLLEKLVMIYNPP